MSNSEEFLNDVGSRLVSEFDEADQHLLAPEDDDFAIFGNYEDQRRSRMSDMLSMDEAMDVAPANNSQRKSFPHVESTQDTTPGDQERAQREGRKGRPITDKPFLYNS